MSIFKSLLWGSLWIRHPLGWLFFFIKRREGGHIGESEGPEVFDFRPLWPTKHIERSLRLYAMSGQRRGAKLRLCPPVGCSPRSVRPFLCSADACPSYPGVG